MNRGKSRTGFDERRQLIENHRAWTARAFCMATAELRGTIEPDQATARTQRYESRRAMAVQELKG